MTDEKLNLTQEWDKVFPKSDKVDHKKVTFHNRYDITLAADLYTSKKAEYGYLTIAFDPSYAQRAISLMEPHFGILNRVSTCSSSVTPSFCTGGSKSCRSTTSSGLY